MKSCHAPEGIRFRRFGSGASRASFIASESGSQEMSSILCSQKFRYRVQKDLSTLQILGELNTF
jgi:hypothetical protein